MLQGEKFTPVAPDHAVHAVENKEKKRLLLEFCKNAEEQLNSLLKGEGDKAVFETNFAEPLRVLARAINDRARGQEAVHNNHEYSSLLNKFIDQRNDPHFYSQADSAEIAIAINHVAGRLHELKG